MTQGHADVTASSLGTIGQLARADDEDGDLDGVEQSSVSTSGPSGAGALPTAAAQAVSLPDRDFEIEPPTPLVQGGTTERGAGAIGGALGSPARVAALPTLAAAGGAGAAGDDAGQIFVPAPPLPTGLARDAIDQNAVLNAHLLQSAMASPMIEAMRQRLAAARAARGGAAGGAGRSSHSDDSEEEWGSGGSDADGSD